MQRRWFVGGMVLGLVLSLPVWAQQPAPTPVPPSQLQAQQQQKSNQYLRIEYERCRSDIAEIWARSDAAEQRVRDLEADVAKLTEELTAVKGKLSEKPAN
jgi:septal ring factor EnvC (AmiA/AmiB activator)